MIKHIIYYQGNTFKPRMILLFLTTYSIRNQGIYKHRSLKIRRIPFKAEKMSKSELVGNRSGNLSKAVRPENKTKSREV